ncbi:chromatin structure-remodeling complex subunit RSC7 [Lithohypha guttulata]|uniref:chromatin structure-remodeling complex subunit RSC7 n=1 Tax=Lithohypha guttulata TaxID=1690604 RepID=UPI002DE1C5B2|nr:chromatin structure-remodeling complex subunit RSC7 [Lithohypha guttulata]KAK5098006.1 chromatin structure-remodeling complex subunit RSC7 [Lithohypha guttulata]
MARRPRLAAQAARASLQTPVPRLSDNEDEDMADAPPTDVPTPQDEDEEGNEEEVDDEEEQNENEELPTPSRALRQSESATPRRRGRGRGRARGRPSARIQSLRNQGSDDGNDASDTPAPRRRGGFRGHRGGRWANKRSGAQRAVAAPVDDEGNVMTILNDEVELPEDAEGETKINKDGELQDGREYRVRTFTLLGRGNRLYMLSTEPARCIGFRDSYLFFQKHKHLYKIIIDDEEKKDLIERELIPHSYKGRSIGVVTARSVFREFGAKIVIGGKKVTDDYDVAGARERGDVEGELAVPEDRIPQAGEGYNRNQYVAWHGASAVYHMNLPSVPMQNGKPEQGKRRKIAVTSDNWMLEHAREAARFNSMLRLVRDDMMNGVYDIHTNTMQYPRNTQPTHARWEEVDDKEHAGEDEVENLNARFSKLEPVYSRNYRIHDLCLESAPESNMPEPGLGFSNPGLAGISSDILDELPVECRAAFSEAAEKELSWRAKWLNESIDGHRSIPLTSLEWYPK